MTVPPGFHVDLIAAEPDIVNPIAMTFDDRGRIWVTESLEYPRKDGRAGQGPGQSHRRAQRRGACRPKSRSSPRGSTSPPASPSATAAYGCSTRPTCCSFGSETAKR